VVEQLPVEMLQQCSNASSCMCTRIIMEEHYTVCQHPTQMALHNFCSVLQYKTWQSSQAADFLGTGTQKLIPQYVKCLNSSTDYVEK
jgi:hypothetical protein